MTYVNRIGASWKDAGLALALGLAGNLACGAETSNASSTTYENVGTLCFTPKDGATELSVYFQDICLAPGCQEFVASCNVEFADGSLNVTSGLVVTDPGENALCPAGCFFERARCDLNDLTPGIYAVTLGQQSGNVTLPAASSISLFGDKGCPE